MEARGRLHPSSPSPVFGGGGAVIRDGGGKHQSSCLNVSDHDLQLERATALLSPSVSEDAATSPEDGGGKVKS
jgi:hypothetical protein